MTFRSVMRFQVKPGREAAFEAALRRAGMLTRPAAVAGFIDAELSLSLSDPSEYLVLARWSSEASYRTWQEMALAEVDADALDDLLDTLVEPAPGRLFRVVESE